MTHGAKVRIDYLQHVLEHTHGGQQWRLDPACIDVATVAIVGRRIKVWKSYGIK